MGDVPSGNDDSRAPAALDPLRRTHDTLARLKFIARLPPDRKIEVGSLRLRDLTLFSRLYRTLLTRSESREGTLAFLAKTFEEAFVLMEGELAAHNAFCHEMRAAIVHVAHLAVTKGLPNLCRTYADDAMFVSRLEALIHVASVRLSVFVSAHTAPKEGD